MNNTSTVLHRKINAKLPVACGGQGIELIDSEGKRFIDASGGAAVSCLGHQHPEVLAAMHRQIDQLTYAHTGFFTTNIAEELSDTLIQGAPAGLSHSYFVSGGSEAVEAALKMARQYFLEIGEPDRCHFIARKQSYHGNTLGALAVGGNEWRRQPFAPMLMPVTHISACYQYRGMMDDESPESYGQRLVAEFAEAIDTIGGNKIIAFVAETVGGATSGAITPVTGYFKGIRELCDRHGILLILDEVMCGMGRCGTRYACEAENIAPDLLTIAKGLSGGYQPIGAVLLSSSIFSALRDGSGYFQHGHTFMGHALACAAAFAVQQIIQRDNLLANVQKQGRYLARRLTETFANHPFVGDIRGRGLFQAIELVEDKVCKKPFASAHKLHAKVKINAMSERLMVYPMGGTIDGKIGDHVLLAPPFIINEAQIDEVVRRLDLALTASFKSIGVSI